ERWRRNQTLIFGAHRDEVGPPANSRFCPDRRRLGKGRRLQHHVLEDRRAVAPSRASELRSGTACAEHRRRSGLSRPSRRLAAISHAVRRAGRLSERAAMNVDARKRALWVVWFAVLVASLVAMVRLNRSAVGAVATNNRYGFSLTESGRSLGVDFVH